MEQFKRVLGKIIFDIAVTDAEIPQHLLFMLEADEADCKLTIKTMLDKEYDITLDHLYSLLPGQAVQGDTTVLEFPNINLN